MTKQTFTQKQTGDSLSASEWNELTGYVNQAVDAINNNNGQSAAIDTSGVVSVNSKGNTTISATKHINIEPAYDANGAANGTYGDVQIKPGDDITLESHHRSTDKRDEITVKTSNGQSGNAKAPVKLQIIAADMTLSSKGKTEDSNVMNINVTDGTTKGYLKVRAQAIDLRSETHGGIALQPKGLDSNDHMNKIKFEHGGGDGLEFGTFNAEKTSIFTDEYRFNKEGVWKMATRTKVESNKKDNADPTTYFKYVKNQSDDFYDNIDVNDEQCTTKDIIKTASAMNNYPGVHTKITNGGNLEIGTNLVYQLIEINSSDVPNNETLYRASELVSDIIPKNNRYYTVSEINSMMRIYTEQLVEIQDQNGSHVESIQQPLVDFNGITTLYLNFADLNVYNISGYYKLVPQPIPNIKIESGSELKLGGILDFGSSFNFGETDNGIEVQYKLTKKNNTKDCGVLKVIGVNNHATNNLTVEGVTIAPGQTDVIAQCSILDIIKLVNYMKTNNEGPWAQQL